MQRFICCLFALLFFTATFAQTIIKGKVVNDKTNEALPFVNLVIKGTTQGTTADVQGRFSLSVDKPVNVMVTYVGFETRTLDITPSERNFIVIALKEKETQLKEVVVRPEDNPALKIIRKVIANRYINDPENLPSFSYNSYNKLSLTLEKTADSIPLTILGKKDSEKQLHKIDSFAAKNNIFVTESFTERKYVNPTYSKETVLANKMTGVKEPFFAFLATNFQPFSFYKEWIPLLNRNYINPISKGSIARYDYRVMDTIYHATDSIFIIAYEPLPGKAFDGLKGQLYISSDGFAIEHVIAEPSDNSVLIETKIHQKYLKISGHWFPEQLNTELRFKEYKLGKHKMMYVSRSYISNVTIGQDIPKNEFGLLNVQFDPQSNFQSDDFWKSHRLDSLNPKEKHTYRFYDSLGSKLKLLNSSVKAFEGLALGRFVVGSCYLPIEHLVKVNQYEGTRLGVGFETGERISKRVTLGGYAGYGFRDKALKYGGSLRINFVPTNDAFLTFSYKQDLNEPGSSNFIKSPMAPIGNESYRFWNTSRMDSIKQYKVELTFRPLRFSQVSFYVQQLNINPTYTYKLITDLDNTGARQNYTIGEMGVQWRYAFKENFNQIGNGKVVTNYTYPQINVVASKALTEFLNGQYDFTKIEVKIDLQKTLRGMGETTIQINAGKIIGNVPYPFLFNGKGSKAGSSFYDNVVVQNYFQTMGLYEFSSDAFAYLFFHHNFGRMVGMRSKFFRPELVLAHNMGFGSLNNLKSHEGIEIKTMEKGFYESGLLLSNLLRFKYVKMLYFGIGAGAFYRYGDYAFSSQADNLAYKINLTVDF